MEQIPVIQTASAPKFYPLTFVQEKSDITVGRLDIDSFAQFPPDGVALLQQMQAGLPPHEAAQWYEQQYHEPIDIEDFLNTLRDLQFIRDENDVEAVPTPSRAVPWQWAGRIAFSPLAWVVYGLLFAFCLYDIVRYPILFPTFQHIFFSPYFTLVELGLFFGQFPGLLFHESFHMLAGRRMGIPSHLRLGRRLYYLVFETSLTGLWSVPARARYLPFLAGMLADALWFSLLTVIAGATLTQTGALPFVGALCLALAFETILRFQWQFYFYLRTDLYYVFTTIFGCIDLQQTTRRFLLNRFFQLIRRPHKIEDETLWNPQDRRVARWYSPLFVLGYLLTITISLSVGIPVTIRFLSGVFTHLVYGYALRSNEFWDSTIFLGLNILQLIIVAAVLWHERQEKRRLASAAAS